MLWVFLIFMSTKQKTALISVYDKTGIKEFAESLVNLGWKIISSGGTAKHLSEAGVPVTDVAEITGMPAILSHRVLTLHPKIHGGLLALNTPEHLAEMEKYSIPYIDLVCCDLYPLEEEIKNPVATRESVIEKTDIGGPTMLRSAAKGRRIVICEVSDRAKVIEWLKAGEPNREEFINSLAAKAEAVVARYCSISGEYRSSGEYKGIFGKKKLECAYGENAYQKPASLYGSPDVERLEGSRRSTSGDPLAIHNWQLVAGSPLSYNNICDVDRMMQTMTHIGAGFEKNFSKVPHVSIGAKHGNACGVGVGDSEIKAVDKMLQGDLRAIFGGSVMLNFNVDEKIAEELIHKFSPEGIRRLLDIVAAPSFSPEAVEILSRKKGKCRILVNPAILKAGLPSLDSTSRFRYVRGGFLTQPNYNFVPKLDPSFKNEDVILAWAIGCTSNSNTITIVKEGRLYGNGVGQQDRVGAAKLAIFRADDAAQFRKKNEENSSALLHPSGGTFREGNSSPALPEQADLENAVAYSDSFFPFPDAPEVLINRGIKTIFSTSGSVNDEKIIELCKTKNVNLIMLPDSEARGFYQH
jgi:phosphoribosylaminoimidazolecarboxamide formyltransferase/IMP cyclohydrolase